MDVVVTTSEVRAALGQITRRFDEGDADPVFFGSHRRAQAVLVPIATWERLLAHAEDQLDLDVADERLAQGHSWLSEEQMDVALIRAMDEAAGRNPA